MALAVVPTAPPNGALNSPYSYGPAATGGTPPYSWSVSVGSLPSWASFTTSGGTTGTFGATIFMSGQTPPTTYPNWQSAVGRPITSTKCYPGSQGGAGGGSAFSDGTGSLKWFPTTLDSVISGLQSYCATNGVTVFVCYKPSFNPYTSNDFGALQTSLSSIAAGGVNINCILWQEVEDSFNNKVGGTASQYFALLSYYKKAVTNALGPGHLFHDASGSFSGKWSTFFPGAIVDGAGVDMYSTSYVNGVRLDPLVTLCNNAGIPFSGVFEMGVSIAAQTIPPAGKTEAQFITAFLNYQNHIETIISANQPSYCMWYQAQGGNLHNLIPGFASGGSISGVTGPNAIPGLDTISDLCTQSSGGTTTITGTPNATGTTSFTLKVTDHVGATATFPTSITIPSPVVSLPVIPVPPVFPVQDSSLANLQALSYAVSFIANNDIKPTWHLYKTATTALAANSWQTVNFGSVAFDSANVSDGQGAVVTTAGYYAVEGCLPVQAGAGGIAAWISFLFVAGPNNPNASPGSQITFGLRGGTATSTAGDDFTLNSSAIAPLCLYPGDGLYLQAYVTGAVSTNVNNNSSYTAGRFVPNFTGTWIRQGP